MELPSRKKSIANILSHYNTSAKQFFFAHYLIRSNLDSKHILSTNFDPNEIFHEFNNKFSENHSK